MQKEQFNTRDIQRMQRAVLMATAATIRQNRNVASLMTRLESKYPEAELQGRPEYMALRRVSEAIMDCCMELSKQINTIGK